MPRNSSGTYSLYTPGNPVVTNTVISSTWANNTLSDLASAITDSLSRSGDGGMLAPLELANGAVGAPGLSWGAESTSGWYRNAAGDFRFSVSSADRLAVSSTGLSVSGSIITSTATGGSQGAGTINATAVYDDGVLLANQSGANPSATIGLAAVNGAAGTFLRSDGAPALSQAIVPTWSGQHTWSQPLLVPQGAVGTPGIAFSTDTNTGLFAAGSDFVAFACGGSLRGGWDGTAAFYQRNQQWNPNGSAGTPSYSFENDQNTGVYLGGTDDLWMAMGGTGYPVGYRGIPSRTITTSDSTAALDNGRIVLFTGAGSQTFTVDSAFGTASNAMTILNGGTGSLAIAESLSGTMTWLNGSGTLSTGSRTLAIGGAATIWMVDANNAYIYGTGLS